ncbi:cytochrome P450 [Ideonella sp.]|uniref:cytochrome P450 n=1 Tax=Ideonella sp. TaxID=1929293 RepID=UPI002B49B059|nr:cytochrome P450 [Ideonella sp.]HJV68569.1 cytochrome P450 [Ideonella sp.]
MPAAGAHPPGPPRRWWGLPLLRAMRADYLGFTEGLQRAHGDLTFMQLGAEQAYDLFTPELVREALVDQADALIRWQRGIEVFEQVFGQSVLVTEGATWQRQRRMLQPAFTPRRVAGYAGLMRDAARSALDDAVPAGQAEAVVAMDGLWTRVAMDVIMRTLFSSSAPQDAREAAAAVQVLSETAMREMFWPLTLPDWWPLPGKAAKRQALRLLRGLVARHIDARRADAGGVERDDLLAHLLALRDDTTGEALSPAEVFDQCMVSFQAGHETSATALLWWSRLMAEHPAALEQAQRELDAHLSGREPEAGDLPALPWLGATLKEAMRLYPPVAAVMTRRTTRDIRLGGHPIPAGALLRITPWVLQRDARWFDAPGAFRPERYLPDARPFPRGAWMPFGTGPRVCIGQHFAILEMTLVAAMLLQRYDLRLPPGTQPAEPVLNVTLRPRGGVRLLLARRSSHR